MKILSMSADADVILMDRDRIARSLKRMAHEIAEQNTTDRPVVLFGINDRGNIVANTLADILTSILDHEVRSCQLLVEDKTTEEKSFAEFDEVLAQNPLLMVVDDVIFSGRTMFNALKAISDHLDPSEIHTAVLIDRGHRKFPVKAEYYGMELPTKLDEHVSVIVENEQLKEVILVNSK